ERAPRRHVAGTISGRHGVHLGFGQGDVERAEDTPESFAARFVEIDAAGEDLDVHQFEVRRVMAFERLELGGRCVDPMHFGQGGDVNYTRAGSAFSAEGAPERARMAALTSRGRSRGKCHSIRRRAARYESRPLA